jgi:hypothetical protein
LTSCNPGPATAESDIGFGIEGAFVTVMIQRLSREVVTRLAPLA